MTDALVQLGYLPPDALLGGRMPISSERASEAIEREIAAPLVLDVDTAAQGILELAAANMTEGIRIASIQRGHDPREFTLVAGGGAGPMFAGILAAELGIETVIVAKVAGAMCAFGEAAADLRYDAVRSYPSRLEDVDATGLTALLDEMEREGRAAFPEDLLAGSIQRVERAADMKYVDQIHHCDVSVPAGPLDSQKLGELGERFHARHEQLYTYCERDNEPEILSIRASVILGKSAPSAESAWATSNPDSTDAPTERALLLPGADARVDVPVYRGESLAAGWSVEGPVVIEEETTTVMVFRGTSATLDGRGFYLLRVGA